MTGKKTFYRVRKHSISSGHAGVIYMYNDVSTELFDASSAGGAHLMKKKTSLYFKVRAELHEIQWCFQRLKARKVPNYLYRRSQTGSLRLNGFVSH